LARQGHSHRQKINSGDEQKVTGQADRTAAFLLLIVDVECETTVAMFYPDLGLTVAE
jgi:hypothetical protein